MVAVVVLAGCQSSDEKDSAFCKSARQSVPRLEATYATFSEAAQSAARVDLEQARNDYTAAVDAVIKTLGRPPAEIRQDAGATLEGLRQQVATVSNVQPGAPPTPFPPDRQAAAGRVDAYLRTTCEVPGSVSPR